MPKEKSEVEEVEVCGHINKHFVGRDGRLQDLVCTLKSHEGDHFAKAPCLVLANNGYEQAKLERVKIGEVWYVEAESDAYWSNAAGVPAAEIQPDLEGLKLLKAQKNASLQ